MLKISKSASNKTVSNLKDHFLSSPDANKPCSTPVHVSILCILTLPLYWFDKTVRASRKHMKLRELCNIKKHLAVYEKLYACWQQDTQPHRQHLDSAGKLTHIWAGHKLARMQASGGYAMIAGQLTDRQMGLGLEDVSPRPDRVVFAWVGGKKCVRPRSTQTSRAVAGATATRQLLSSHKTKCCCVYKWFGLFVQNKSYVICWATKKLKRFPSSFYSQSACAHIHTYLSVNNCAINVAAQRELCAWQPTDKTTSLIEP